VNIFGISSEYDKLSSVILYKPGIEIENYPDPAGILHLRPIDHSAIASEYTAIIATFKALGVTVTLIDPAPIDTDNLYRFNMMYCRDLFFMTSRGAILAKMANDIRAEETLCAAQTLRNLGIPLLHTVSGDGRFEGADALWIRKDLVLVGVGNRTNELGYHQIRDVLQQQEVKCAAIPSSQVTTQHLLGSVQIVDQKLALVRHEIIDPEVVRFLEGHGFVVVKIPENREVQTRQAMNIVTIAPRTIIMTANCPMTRSLYLKAGLTIASELDLTQLMNGAGGLACATGIVARGGNR
jgi:N-dimethylarginine dimethylaminohydrolase